MTTLNTGLPIDHQFTSSKLTPALRISIQKATSTFQKDFCYDFLQAIVEETEVSDSIGIRLFLNFCLKKPETLIESWNDSIDQTLDSNDLYHSSDLILSELDNFLDFIDGLIQIINTTELFKLQYHEIDAWNLSYKLLDSIQRKLYELALIDLSNAKSNSTHQLTIASDSTSSPFYQAFMSLDKYLKHTFDSRVLLEPAKLVDHLTDLNERQIELKSFKNQFPTIQSSTILTKKFGRFGREELAIDQFLDSDKFKELIKLKNSVGGAQLTRQPSTRVRKSTSHPDSIPTKSKSKRSSSTFENESNSKRKSKTTLTNHNSNRSNSNTLEIQSNPTHIDPFLIDVENSPILGKIAFADAPRSSPSSNQSIIQSPIQSKPIKKSNESNKKSSTTNISSSKKRKTQQDEFKKTKSIPNNSTTQSNKKRKSKSLIQDSEEKKSNQSNDDKEGNEDDDDDGIFVIEKIIGEKVNKEGQRLYKVLWAGYPESESTWQAFDSLADCAAIDIWEEEKKTKLIENKKKKVENSEIDGKGEKDEEVVVENEMKSPAAIIG